MASYSAVIDVRVQGQNDLNAVTDSVGRLEALIRKVKPVPNLFDRRATADVIEVKRGLENLIKAYADGNTRIAKFSSSIAGVNQQLTTFNAIAANAKVGSEQFTNALTAAARASTNLLSKELARFSTLQNIYERQPAGGLSAQEQGPSKTVRDLLDLQKTVPNSVAALERYQRELLDVQNIVSKTSVEYRELATAIRQVDVALGKGGQFGPAAPPVQGPLLPGNLGGGMNLPPGMARMGKPPAAPAAGGITGLLKKPGVADALIGGSFPLLFGGGAGAAAGGFAGGLIGGAMGSPLGMALSLAMSAVGQKIDEAIAKIKDLQKAISGLNVDALRDSFIVVNAELETTIRRLVEAGKYDEARAVAAEAVAAQTGASSAALTASATAATRLSSAWDAFSGTVSTTVALLTEPFSNALSGALNLITFIVKGVNTLLSLGQALESRVGVIVNALLPGVNILASFARTLKVTSEESEKIKALAEAEIEAYDRKLALAIQLAQIDKARTNNVSLMGKLINLEADRQEQVANIQAAADDKRRQARTQLKGVDDALLNTLLMQIGAEEKAAIAAVNRKNARQRELEFAREQLAIDQQRIDLFNIEAQVTSARQTAAAQILQAETQQLEQRRGIAGSLNGELALINQIAAAKVTSAQQTYATAVQEQNIQVENARLRLEQVKNQSVLIPGMQRQVELAQAEYNAKVQVRDATVQAAGATQQAAVAAADLERRTAAAAVAAQAYASSAARITERLNEASNSLNNQNNVYQSMVSALNTANNAQIQMLQTQLNTTQTVEMRLSITRRIAVLEKANARNTYLATIAQINADIERLRVASAIARVKELEALYTLRTALAQKVATQAHWDAYYAARSASDIAYDNYLTSIAVGKNMAYAAAVTYNAAVYAADMRVSTEYAAIAAGKYADNIGQAANNIATLNRSASSSSGTSGVSGTSVFFAGGTVTAKFGGIPGLQSIADAEVANQQAGASLFSQENTSNSSFSTPTQTETSVDTPNVNITTGPVVEFDGTKYVTLSDLESAVQNTVSGIVGRLRTPSARIALGIA